MEAQHTNKATANNSSTPAKMPKRRGKSAAAKQQKTPKNPFEGAVLIRACCGCAGSKPTRPKEEEEGERKFYHNKKKLERLLNAKIYVKDEEQEKKEDQPRSRTDHERCCHNKGKKPERALNDKEEQGDAEAIIKALDKWCKDNSHMNIKFKAYVL